MVLGLKNPPASAGDIRGMGSSPGLGRSSGGGNGNPLWCLPGEAHGQRSLAGYSAGGHKHNQSDLALLYSKSLLVIYFITILFIDYHFYNHFILLKYS